MVRNKESNELRACSYLHRKVDGPNLGYGLFDFVLNVWRAISFGIRCRRYCSISLKLMKMEPATVSRVTTTRFIDQTVGLRFA